MSALAALPDHELLVRLMVADMLAAYDDTGQEVAELSAECNRRYGAGASDRSADHFTGWHYSSTDIVLAAALHPDRIAAIMRHGGRDCCPTPDRDSFPHLMHCARIREEVNR